MRTETLINILFWNIKKKNLAHAVSQIVAANDVDIAILAENVGDPNLVLSRLRVESREFVHFPTLNERYNIYSRSTGFGLHVFYSDSRVSLRTLTLHNQEFTLGVVHLIDKRNSDEADRLGESQSLSERLRTEEQGLGHARTVLIGDFNLNPFEFPMNKPHCLNALMTRECISNKTRTVKGEKYPFFYNPMWKFFGDYSHHSPGTFYHGKSSNGYFGWNILDQVLLRPDVLSRYHDVRILTKAGEESLLTKKKRPRSKVFSDHLPILLSLK